MKKFFVFVSLLILCVMNVFGEIPDNVIISDNKSVEYEVVDNEKLKVIISIDGVKYSEILFYAFYQDGNCIEIPVPKYLCVYKNSIVLIQGYGTSYRNIIVYQREGEKIIKYGFENSLAMSTLPRTFEKYMIIYNQNPVLILHNQDNTLFYTVKKKVEKEISKIVIDSTKIILFFVDNDLEEIPMEFYDNTNFEAGGYTLYRTSYIYPNNVQVVDKLILTQVEVDALVCLTYNSPRIGKMIVDAIRSGCSDEEMKAIWLDDSDEQSGIGKRRLAEWQLYSRGIYNEKPYN